MIRIDRDKLDACVEAFLMAAVSAKNTSGLKIMFLLDPRKAEAAVLGALSIVAPMGGPVMPSDVYLTHEGATWPPRKTGE